jgi:predicted nucleic acid-binding protein
MIYGIDTGFLVAAEVMEHADHSATRVKLAELNVAGDELAIAPQVLAEFIHVVTDSKRFAQPLETSVAINLAEQWWTARDVRQVLPTDAAMRQFLEWMRQHSLGRKRLLDTLLAATYSQAGITAVLTTNPRDFTIFGCFQCVTPAPEKGGVP